VVLLTHGHADHIEGVNLLRERYPGVPVAIHEADAGMLADPMSNVSGMLGCRSRWGRRRWCSGTASGWNTRGWRSRCCIRRGTHPAGRHSTRPMRRRCLRGYAVCGVDRRTDFPGGNYAKLIASVRGGCLRCRMRRWCIAAWA